MPSLSLASRVRIPHSAAQLLRGRTALLRATTVRRTRQPAKEPLSLMIPAMPYAKSMKRFAIVGLFVALNWAGAGKHLSAQQAQEMQEVEPAVATVTVTNLAKGQILTPAVFITHNDETPALFVPGEAASSELSALAEQGRTTGLINKFNAETGVLDVTLLSAFVRPTRTATVNVKFDADHRLISSASMIEMTNDGFVSLLGVEVPCVGTSTYFLDGWDAGSEANTELCSQIPAPCPTPRRPGSCSVAIEGAVHIHSGIHGCGGFPPEVYHWLNPVAKITIQVSPDLSPAGALEAACPDAYPASSDTSGAGS